MTAEIETVQSVYSQCIEDLVDYQEHFISQRREYTSTQLMVFLYAILGAFLVYTNHHIALPIEHGLLCSLVLLCGLVFYTALFNVNIFVERRWQIGVGFTIKDIQKALRNTYGYTYSVDSGFMELTLLATLVGLVGFSFSAFLTMYSVGAVIGVISAIITFVTIKIHLGNIERNLNNARPDYLAHDGDMTEIIKAWKIQKSLIDRMSFVNKSLNIIRKTLLVSFIVYIAVITADIFTKDISISIKFLGLYGLLSAFVFQIVILTIWNYDIIETQSDGKIIFEKGLELENSISDLPSVWHDIGASAPESFIVFHMNNLYFFPLILSQIIGSVFVLSSKIDLYLKTLILVSSCGISLLLAGFIIWKSFSKKAR